METQRYSVTETAKLIRKALKEAFPGSKFSVRSERYAGGASIDIRWTDGPIAKDVEAISKVFQGAWFDGMQDLKCYNRHTMNGQRVSFSADYIFCHREVSDQLITTCDKAWYELNGKERCDLMNSSPSWMRRGDFDEWEQNPGRCLAAMTPFIQAQHSKTAASVQLVEAGS